LYNSYRKEIFALQEKDKQYDYEYNVGNNKKSTKLRVSPSNLVELSSIVEDSNVKKELRYKVIHKNIKPRVSQLLSDYPGVVITDALRSNIDSENTALSDKNSIHKYGHAIDIRLAVGKQGYKEGRVLAELLTSSKLARERYGVIKAYAHGTGDNYHLHLEFKPNIL
jgi:hypothetical protein